MVLYLFYSLLWSFFILFSTLNLVRCLGVVLHAGLQEGGCAATQRSLQSLYHRQKVFVKQPHFLTLGSLYIYSASNRYTEERSEFASKLREPVDGCGNCGFWRDTLETCARCCQVSLDVGVMEKLKETWCVSLMTLDTTPPSSAGVILLLQM